MTYIILFGKVKFSPTVLKHGYMVGALTERYLHKTKTMNLSLS